jgi:hypothetical protein
MGGNESVEDRVVKNTTASLIVSQVMVCRLIIIVELHTSATSNNSFRRLCYCKAIHFVKGAVESLHWGESTHIPDTEHTRNICRDNLVGALHPLNTN